MPSNFPAMMPGISSPITATHRTIFKQIGEIFLAQGRLIDGTLARDALNNFPTDVGVLRPGTLMGKVTTGGKYANSIIDVIAGAYTSGGTTFTLSLAGAAELNRRLGASSSAGYVIGPPSANGTVAKTALTYSAIDLTTGIVTCTSLGVNKVAGSFVTPGDGSETPITFIPDWDYGVRVTDLNGTGITVDFPKMPVAGIIHSANFLPVWPSDTSLQTWIVNALSTFGLGKYIFDHLA